MTLSGLLKHLIDELATRPTNPKLTWKGADVTGVKISPLGAVYIATDAGPDDEPPEAKEQP